MPITLVQKYNPKWPLWFAKIRERLEACLAGIWVEIEHVGSTSVPGMTAKPIIVIDLDVVKEGAIREVIYTKGQYFDELWYGMTEQEWTERNP